jgi:predicted RNA-binding protein YlxR (DUF448 family)
MSHLPLRRCRVCRTQHPKPELLRWTIHEGNLVQDAGQQLAGRGYYSCSPKCAEILPKTIKGLKKT